MTTELVKQSAPTALNLFDKDQFDTLQRICTMFASSELVPEMYRISDKNPKEKALANCMIAIEISQRIGASPLLVMQNLTIIYGRPSWSAKFLISTVNTCGRYETLRYKITNLGKVGKIEYTVYDKTWVDGRNGGRGHYENKARKEVFDGTNLDNLEFVAYSSQRGKDTVLESSPVSIKMAIQEGWYTKAGSKWPTMPQQMLIYRSASFWTNAYAPELSMGMKTIEEVQDTIDLDSSQYSDVTKETEAEIKTKANKNPIKNKVEEKPPVTTVPESPKAEVKNEPPKQETKVEKQIPPQPEKPENNTTTNTEVPPSMREGTSSFEGGF